MPAAARRPLARYDAKRRFDVTSEPRGGRVKARSSKALAFVVQKHDATRLHYDFRLEHDGVLWSWAVPKGPSLDPSVRRLAARTEDHPLDYASFEGVIPEGEYGGGPVIVWDRGTWQPIGDPARGMKDGHLRFTLAGEKLSGAFHLVRLRPKGNEKESWLLFKSKDAAAATGSAIVEERPESVLSGRSIAELRDGRSPKKPPRARKTKDSKSGEGPSSLAAALEAMSLGFSITSPEKVLDAGSGLTKAELMAYLAWVAPRMLPLVRGRPLMLMRCPEGRAGQCFFQKHTSPGMPDPIRHVAIVEKTGRGASLVIDDVAGLVALGQIGVLEIHTWMGRADRIERPDQMVLDIDPDESLPFARVAETALSLREIFTHLGVKSFVKTTGGKGLHVVAPLTPGPSWEAHEAAALRIAEHLSRSAPGRYVTTMRKAARRGKIFLDYLRNGRGATAIAPYSPRARDGVPIAMPCTWTALERGEDPRGLTLRALVDAGLPKNDPWRGYQTLHQAIDAKALAAL